VHVFITFTPYQALGGNVSVLHSVRAGSNTGRQKTLLFVIFFSPSERTFRGSLNKATTALFHIDPDSFIIHYTRHYTVLSYRQHRNIKPQIQTVQYRSMGRNIFQSGNSRQKWLGTEAQKCLKHVNILKH
jgi:hypothetical protein